jgi:hypothetical protein
MQKSSLVIVVILYVLAMMLLVINGQKQLNNRAVNAINSDEPIVCKGKQYDNYVIGSEFVFVGDEAKEVYLKSECKFIKGE